MDDLKQIVAANITDLRKKNNITQAELAQRLNYTDKAVSKWERGESLPDVAVLKQIADIFAVKIDYLVTAEHPDKASEPPAVNRRRLRNHRLIAGMSIVLVWLIATFVFVNIQLVLPNLVHQWLAFVFAVPVSCIVWLVFNAESATSSSFRFWCGRFWRVSICASSVWHGITPGCCSLSASPHRSSFSCGRASVSENNTHKQQRATQKTISTTGNNARHRKCRLKQKMPSDAENNIRHGNHITTKGTDTTVSVPFLQLIRATFPL